MRAEYAPGPRDEFRAELAYLRRKDRTNNVAGMIEVFALMPSEKFGRNWIFLRKKVGNGKKPLWIKYKVYTIH